MGQDLGVIAADVAGRQAGAEKRLHAAIPGAVERSAAVLRHHAVPRVVGRPIQIIIAVLVVDGENIAEPIAGIGKTLQALPAARVRAGRKDIGVKIVVSAETPAVQVDVGAFDALGGQGFQFGRPRVEGHELMVLGRILFIIIAGRRLDVVKDAGVDDGRSDELPDQRVAGDLFLQRNEIPGFGRISAVALGQFDVIPLA